MEHLMNNELGAFLLYQQVACVAMKNQWYPLAEYILAEAQGELVHFDKFRKYLVDNGHLPVIQPRMIEYKIPETVEEVVRLIQKLEHHVEKEMAQHYETTECTRQKLFLEDMLRLQYEDSVEADDLVQLYEQYKEHFLLMLKLRK